MSLTIKPFEQIIAEAATTIAVNVGAKSNAEKLARAEAALTVSGIFQVASTGDLTTAAQQLESIITGPNMDPGVAKVISDLSNVGNVFLSADAAVIEASPLIGAEADAIAGAVAAGMASIANAYIAKYTPPTPAPAPAAT